MPVLLSPVAVVSKKQQDLSPLQPMKTQSGATASKTMNAEPWQHEADSGKHLFKRFWLYLNICQMKYNGWIFQFEM